MAANTSFICLICEKIDLNANLSECRDRKSWITLLDAAQIRKHKGILAVPVGENGCPDIPIFLLTGLRIYTGEYKAQGPTLCPTVGRALRGPRALYSPV